MKMIKFALIGLLGFGSLFGAVEKKETVPSPKDEFLSFITEKARQYSDKAEAGLGKAYELAKQEAPELLKEFIRWRICYHSIQTLFGMGLVVGCFFLWKWRIKHSEHTETRSLMPPVFVSVMVLTGWLCFYTVQALSLVQIIVSPRIYIIEQAANLLK